MYIIPHSYQPSRSHIIPRNNSSFSFGDPNLIYHFEYNPEFDKEEYASDPDIGAKKNPIAASLCWSTDGQYLCVGGTDGSIHMIDINTQKGLF